MLVTSITGPGLVLIPYVFQAGGWFMYDLLTSPTIMFIFIAILSGLAGLFVIEAVSKFPGNDNFEVFIIDDRGV